jgi:hypothetical protein
MKKYIIFGLVIVAILSVATILIVDALRYDTVWGETKATQGVVIKRTYRPATYRPKMGDIPAQHTPASWRTLIQCDEINTLFHLRGQRHFNRAQMGMTVTVMYRAKYKVRKEQKFNQELQKNETVEVERQFRGYHIVSWE